MLRKNRIIFAFALSIACLSLNGQTLPVGGDSHVNSAYPALNFGGSVYLAVGGTSTGYLQFDLSTLPAGTNVANVTKVNLVLFVSRIVTPGSIQVAEASGAWSEYGIQAGNAPGAGAVVGTAAIPANPGFVSVDVTSSVVKWLTNPGQNNGFVISGVGSAVAFLDSKESVTTSHQAILSFQQAGPQGATGPTGPAGLTGATGPTGPAGLNGATGPAGPAGVTGPTGAMGAAGPTGASGAAGLNGATGSAGPAGLNGANGAVGATGPTGATGATGFLSPVSAYVSDTTYGAGAVVFYQGSSYQSSVANNQNHVPGTDGNWTVIAQQGFAGATGATGAAGAQGIAGTAGANGATGAPGPTGLQGPAGPTGPAGPQGVAGTPGANGATGAQGPTGTQGPAGPAGPAGPTGAQGVAGTPGSPGANGASGVGTMLIANFSNSPTPFNYYAFNSSNVSTNVSFSVAQTLMPAACTFDTMYVSAVPTGGSPAADSLIYVLYVNGNSTPLQVSLTTSTTTDTATKGSMTGGSVSVAAGDGVAIGVSQSNGSPVIRSAVSVRCL